MYMRGRVSIALVIAFVAAVVPSQAQPSTLWQIGKFDQSSEEFGESFGGARGSQVRWEPVYRVGQSNWKKDWPAFQPGSANGLAGGREHPFTVLFSLDHPPRGLYTLTVAILAYMPRRPDLRVEVNGKRGMLYLRPHISYDLGNFPVAYMPQYSFEQIEIPIPTRYFEAGENKIVFTCVDDPSTPEDSTGTAGVGVSGIFWDAVKLDEDPAKKFFPGEASATVTPTVFYREKGGNLVEVIEAIVRLNQKVSKGQAILDLNGRQLSVALSASPDFGEQRLEFEVPEWSGTTKSRLRVQAGGTRNFDFALQPARKWTVFVVPHTHLDIGYTDYQGKVAEAQARVLGQAAQLIRENPDFRFSMDASWNLEQYLATRSEEKQDGLLNLIRQDKIGLPVEYCNLLTGYASLETLYRSLYPSKALSRRYGLPFLYANITDVPSYTGAYPSVLASAGVRYFAAAANNWRAPILLYGRWNEKSPFWWEGPDGQKVLVWYSRHYSQVHSLFGLPPVLPAVHDSLPVFLQAYSTPEYQPDAVLIYGTQVENTDLVPGTATFVNAWDREYAYPHLRYATFTDFFKYIEENYGKDLPTYKGDGGPYWEDGVGSDAYFVAEDRENQSRALSAEVVSTVTHNLDPALYPPQTLVGGIWRNIILFAEHTWASWNSISMPDHAETVRQLEVKDDRATAARLEINELANRSQSQLADHIRVPANTLVVFNALSWRRDALVETDLFGRAVLTDLTTGENVPFEVISKNHDFFHVRFLARDLPSVGYKCYGIEYSENAPEAPSPPPSTRPAVVENNYYRITLDEASGAVASIFDKELKREIVNSHSPYKFDQYIYVTGGDGNTQMVRPVKTWPRPELMVHPASDGEIVSVTHTPFGKSIRLRSKALNTPEITTEILLFDRQKKIEFVNHVRKDSIWAKEGVYIAFPTATKTPAFAYSTQVGWIDPARDLLKGASLEWFNVQYWMAARDDQLAVGIVPLDAPLAAFGDIYRGNWREKFEPKSSTLFSYVMNNYWDTNYRAAQSGDFIFRYVVTSSAKFDPEALTRLGWTEMRPVELNYVVGQDKVGNPARPLPPGGASFLEIDQPNVALVTWKLAEDGAGTILRLAEIGGRDTAAALTFSHFSLHSASVCNSVEDNLRPLSVEDASLRLALKPHEIFTLRLQ